MVQQIEARAILSAADKTGAIFSKVANKVRQLNSVAAQANRTTASTGRMARAATAASAAGAAANASFIAAASRVAGPAAVAYGGARSFSNFAKTDLAMRRIGITADATDEQIAAMQSRMRDLAVETGKSFEEVSAGMESLVAGGMNLPEALPAIPAIARTAQAAGAEIQDMATTTLALNSNLGIATDKMQNAFDILVTGGKAGKFELKDMARYLPSIAPAAVAVGMKGEEGLMKIVSALQTIRQGTGTTEEAATSLQNIFAKMESDATVKKFEKFGIDLRKEMTKARKEGKDLLEVFTDLTMKATKGDLSKIPQLFTDMEFARGMRALLSFGDTFKDVMNQVRNASGSGLRDLDRVLKSPQISVNRLSESFSRLSESLGHFIQNAGNLLNKDGTSGILDDLAKKMQFWAENGWAGFKEQINQNQDRLELMGELDKATAIVAGREKALRDNEKALFRRDDETTAQWQRDLEKFRVRKFELEDTLRMRPVDGPLLTDKDIQEGKRLQAIRDDHDRELRRAEAMRHTRLQGAMMPMPRTDPRKGGGSGAPGSEGIPPVQPLDVTAKLTGEAEVRGETVVTVKVEPSGELLRVVETAKSTAQMVGKLRANGPGSTGVSSPDAAPAQRGASGAW